jgi:AcrR family transcriptional regulator
VSSAIPYVETGRKRQKRRTSEALIAAARELLATGVTPTVEQAAAAASIARATAYRYFPNRRALLVAVPELTSSSLLGESPPADVEARLAIVAAAIARQAVEHEPALRTMLRLSLESDPGLRADLPLRVGRRIQWVGEALEPLRGRLPARDLDRLVLAIAAAVGIDALVWLTDVAGLSRPRAVATMEWSAHALLRAALGDAATPA